MPSDKVIEKITMLEKDYETRIRAIEEKNHEIASSVLSIFGKFDLITGINDADRTKVFDELKDLRHQIKDVEAVTGALPSLHIVIQSLQEKIKKIEDDVGKLFSGSIDHEKIVETIKCELKVLDEAIEKLKNTLSECENNVSNTKESSISCKTSVEHRIKDIEEWLKTEGKPSVSKIETLENRIKGSWILVVGVILLATFILKVVDLIYTYEDHKHQPNTSMVIDVDN